MWPKNITPVPRRQKCNWCSVDWSSAEHQEMSRTPHYWREHVASWSLSALPVCQEGSKWGTQISTRAWPGQPRLEPPRPQVEGSKWPALSPLWTQMCYCSLKIILQLTLWKNVCGKLRKCLPSTSGDVQHHVLAIQIELDGVHLHIWTWDCYYRAWKYQEFVINLLCYIPGVDGEKQEMVFLLGSVHLTLPQSRLPWWGLQFSETWLTQICTVEWPPSRKCSIWKFVWYLYHIVWLLGKSNPVTTVSNGCAEVPQWGKEQVNVFESRACLCSALCWQCKIVNHSSLHSCTTWPR